MNRVVGSYGYSNRAQVWRGVIPGTHEPGFTERPIVEDFRAAETLRAVGLAGAHAFTMGDCRILMNREPAGIHGEMRWHLTISCATRHPSWDEIKTARYRLLGPDTVIAMILPQPRFYVNVAEQDHVFQLWEVDDDSRLWENG